ncbi:hypothetical protein [Lonepinella sp. BR2357]|uniref:hypothetical protein n=1 Tax=Lonepinella sp. BR2357 TaxID=3434549 RepID=UPI003F6DD1C0
MKKIALLISSSLFILSNSVFAQTSLSQSEQYLADFLAGKNVANELTIRKPVQPKMVIPFEGAFPALDDARHYFELSKMQKKKLGAKDTLYIHAEVANTDDSTVAGGKDFLNYIKMNNITISNMKFTPDICNVDKNPDFSSLYGYLGTTLAVFNAKLNNEEFSIIRTIMYGGTSGLNYATFYFTKEKLNIKKCNDFKKVVNFLGNELQQ